MINSFVRLWGLQAMWQQNDSLQLALSKNNKQSDDKQQEILSIWIIIAFQDVLEYLFFLFALICLIVLILSKRKSVWFKYHRTPQRMGCGPLLGHGLFGTGPCKQWVNACIWSSPRASSDHLCSLAKLPLWAARALCSHKWSCSYAPTCHSQETIPSSSPPPTHWATKPKRLETDELSVLYLLQWR